MKVTETHQTYRRFKCPVPDCHQTRIMERNREIEEKLVREQQ